MRVLHQSFTGKGRDRSRNEDVVVVDDETGFFAVCDGTRGAAGASDAAGTVAQIVRARVRDKLPEIAAAGDREGRSAAAAVVLRDAVQRASYALATENRYSPGAPAAARRDPAAPESDKPPTAKSGARSSTVTALLLLEGAAVMAHVGNSRLYLRRRGELSLLSQDHTYVRDMVLQGLLTPENARRSGVRHVLSRAVGLFESVQVDTLCFDTAPGDELLLCTDGFSEAFDGDQALAGSADSATPEALFEKAVTTGPGDDASLVWITVPGDAAPRDADQVLLRMDALRSVPLFAGLTVEELLRVMEASHLLERPAGSRLIGEGDQDGTMFVLVEGGCEVTKGGAPVARLGPGDHFGEVGLVSERPRSATVTTTAPSRVIAFGRADFLSFVKREPRTGVSLLLALSRSAVERLAAE